MNKSIDILTFGDLCVDLILSGSDVVPEFDQKEKLIDEYSLEMGGSCCIFACQTAKLGLKTAVVGNVGQDVFGDLVYNTLADTGVSTKYINKDPKLTTGITVALNKGNDRAMLTYNGTIDSIVRGHITDELLKQVRHFHLGSYFLMKKIQPHYPEILDELKKYGATISLDTNWDPEEKWDSGIWDILPKVDIFLPNLNEAMAISREDDEERAINRLKGVVDILVIKMGKDGGIAYQGDAMYKAEALTVDVMDTIGAGDSFDGGFIYGFLNKKSIEESLRIACICGSLSTTKAGGIGGQPTLDKVKQFLE